MSNFTAKPSEFVDSAPRKNEDLGVDLSSIRCTVQEWYLHINV